MSAQRSFSSCPSSSSSAFDSCTGRLTTNARTKAVMKPFCSVVKSLAVALPLRPEGIRPRLCGTAARARESGRGAAPAQPREREREKKACLRPHTRTQLSVVRWCDFLNTLSYTS